MAAKGDLNGTKQTTREEAEDGESNEKQLLSTHMGHSKDRRKVEKNAFAAKLASI
jgi:hypothetical protein